MWCVSTATALSVPEYGVNKTRSCCMLSFTALHQASVSLTQCTHACTRRWWRLIWACCHLLSQHVSHWLSLRLSGYLSVCSSIFQKLQHLINMFLSSYLPKTYLSQVQFITLHLSSCPAEWLLKMPMGTGQRLPEYKHTQTHASVD